ncbi:hypothetical protein OROGR_027251 [Orobanche gracilis]
MEAKLAALGTEVANLHSTLTAMQLQAISRHQKLLSLLTQSLKSKSSEGDKEVIDTSGQKYLNGKEKGESTRQTVGSGWTKLNGEFLDGFCQSEKKVERHGSTSKGVVCKQLSSLQQNGSVKEYVLEFERWDAQIPKLLDSQHVESEPPVRPILLDFPPPVVNSQPPLRQPSPPPLNGPPIQRGQSSESSNYKDWICGYNERGRVGLDQTLNLETQTQRRRVSIARSVKFSEIKEIGSGTGSGLNRSKYGVGQLIKKRGSFDRSGIGSGPNPRVNKRTHASGPNAGAQIRGGTLQRYVRSPTLTDNDDGRCMQGGDQHSGGCNRGVKQLRLVALCEEEAMEVESTSLSTFQVYTSNTHFPALKPIPQFFQTVPNLFPHTSSQQYKYHAQSLHTFSSKTMTNECTSFQWDPGVSGNLGSNNFSGTGDNMGYQPNSGQTRNNFGSSSKLEQWNEMLTKDTKLCPENNFHLGFFKGSGNNSIVHAYELKARIEHILERIALIKEVATVFNINGIFEEACGLTDYVEQKSQKVLVPCFEEGSRITVLLEAWQTLNQIYRQLQPNDGFAHKLQKLDQKLQKRKTATTPRLALIAARVFDPGALFWPV